MPPISRRRTATLALLAAGALVLGSAGPAPAEEPDGLVNFAPVRSNLAAKPWVTVSASTAQAGAGLAVDGDPTTAWTARGKGRHSLVLDLGGAYDNIRKVGLVFPDAHGTYRYMVAASADGHRWETIVDRTRNDQPGRGEEHLVAHAGIAFLRVTITDVSPGAVAGISELSVWNYLRDDVVLGADISYADQDDAQGLTYVVDEGAAPVPILEAAADAGMEYVRLRVFNDPRDEQTGEYLDPAYQSPERTLDVARKVVDQGMGLGIDLHYADSWADPSKQAKPAAWSQLPFEELTQAVYDYTYATIDALVAQGTTPDKVAVGNELINGFMWGSERPQPWFDDSEWCGTCFFNHDPSFVSQPGGGLLWDYWGSDDPAEQAAYDAAWDRFTTLQASGIKAVRDVSAAHGADIQVETHAIIDNGRVDKTLEFWDQFLTRLNAKGQDIDVIAHSYYPEWHGTPEHYESNLHQIAAAHPGYAMEIAETSHQSNDWDGLPVPNSPYPKTAEGAGLFLQDVFRIANDLPGNRGAGVLVWEPANWQEMIDWSNSAWPVLRFHETIEVYEASDAEFVVADTVYRTVRTSSPLRLPATVDVLDFDGTLHAVPVTWDAVPARAPSRPGQLVLSGTTAEHGPVTAVVDVVRRALVTS